MEVVYHESHQTYQTFTNVKLLRRQMQEQELPDHHDTNALVLNFTLFSNKCYDNLTLDEEEVEETPRRLTRTIPDLHEIGNNDIKLLASRLYLHEIFDEKDEHDCSFVDQVVKDIVPKVRKEVRRIRKSDSNKGPKVVYLNVDVNRVRFLGMCQKCTDDARDKVLKKTLKRERVVTDDHDDVEEDKGKKEDSERKRRRVECKSNDVEEDEGKEEDSGRKRRRVVRKGNNLEEDKSKKEDSRRKRRRVVCENNNVEEGKGKEEDSGRKRGSTVRKSEVCSICINKFVVGSKDVEPLPCSHMFHGKCINAWFRTLTRGKRKRICPICRCPPKIKIEKPRCSN